MSESKENLDHELAKVVKDRELAMKKKDELVGILSQAAQALKSSLLVRSIRPIIGRNSQSKKIHSEWIGLPFLNAQLKQN